MVTQFDPDDHLVHYICEILKILDGGAEILKKIQKLRYLGNGLTDRHSIWHDDAYWPWEPDQRLKFRTFRNPRRKNCSLYTLLMAKDRKL